MHRIPNKVDFYITNVCNLTCNGCNRFNNHNFRGWQRWSNYESDYQRWGQITELRAATIMGGEPFLNPTLGDWISGINNIFDIEVQVLTNGTRFQQSKHLYEKFLYWSKKNQCRNHIGVSLHDINQLDQLHSDIEDFLQSPINVFPKGHIKNRFNSDYQIEDCNGVIVNIYIVDQFSNSSLISIQKITGPDTEINFHQEYINTFKLHSSDPIMAHNNCAFVNFKSYHFIRGRLYKCGPVALMPEFDQQHQLEILDSDRELLNSYKSLGIDNFESYHQEFFANLDQVIPQCKFCPETFETHKIFPIRKGSN
jgi:organic radical activating enzyme